jgi:hypothetical protein
MKTATQKQYIFTEIVGCGKIGRIALDSFHKYHDYKVHIYGTKTDFEQIIPHANNIFIEVTEDIIKGYAKGHLGTALLWEKIIKNTDAEVFIHFDSDVIFRANIINFMIEKSKEYDLIGPIRNYHHNPHHNDKIKKNPDLCQTNCTLFKKDKISKKHLDSAHKDLLSLIKEFSQLSFSQAYKKARRNIANILLPSRRYEASKFARMIQGTYNPFNFEHIDFFDPVMFDMIMNDAKIYHLDFNEVGGCDYYGKRDNVFKELNNYPTPYKLDFGSKLVHFSCVGSGMNFYHNREKIKGVGKAYVDSALDRYALFCKIFYDENLPGIDTSKYSPIIAVKNWY